MLIGGNGSDHYIYHNGDGEDVIVTGDSGEKTLDKLSIIGVSAETVKVLRNNDDLLLSMPDGGSIRVAAYFRYDGDSASVLAAINFDDGTVWDSEVVRNKAIKATPQNDNLYGYRTDDVLEGLGGDDIIHGNDGNDDLNGNAGNDYLYGDQGHDKLNGGHGDDILDGGAGHDQLVGGRGIDILQGGAGNDTYIWQRGDGNDTISQKGATTGDHDRLHIPI